MTFHHTGWDPLEELHSHGHNIAQLIAAHNRNQELLRDLVSQHSDIVQLVKGLRSQVNQLQHQVTQFEQSRHQ